MNNFKNKFYFPGLLCKIFNKPNLNKILIIFIVGFTSRIFINYMYNINVFVDYLNKVSIIYYVSMSMFTVLIHEIITFFNINIIPSYAFNSINYIIKVIHSLCKYITTVFNNIFSINKKIFDNLKLRDFTISSIRKLLKDNPLFNSSSKLSLSVGQENELNSNCDNNVSKNLNTNILSRSTDSESSNKNSNASSPDNGRSRTSTRNRDRGDNRSNGSSRVSHRNRSNNMVESREHNNQNNISPTSHQNDQQNNVPINLLDRNRMDAFFSLEGVKGPSSDAYLDSKYGYYRIDGSPVRSPNSNHEYYESNYDNVSYTSHQTPDVPKTTGYYPTVPATPKPSNLSTPSTSAPSFRTHESESIDSANKYSTNRVSPSYKDSYHLPATTYDPKTYKPNYTEPVASSQEIPRDSYATSKTVPLGYQGPDPNLSNNTDSIESSYELTATYMPGNTNSNQVHKNTGLINNPRPLGTFYEDGNNINWTEERNKIFNNYHNQGYSSKEVVVPKKGLLGKVKLGFKYLDDKMNNIDTVYVSFRDKKKRKFVWTLWEKNSGNYESYEDFKSSWNPKTSIWGQIKERTRKDMRMDIENMLGVSRTTKTLGSTTKSAIQPASSKTTGEVNNLIRKNNPFKHKIVKHKNKKIWLTVNINITNNTTFTLIPNLPFNTQDYNDALIVLENNIKFNLLFSRADLLNYMTISYHIEKRKFNFAKLNLLMFTFVPLIIIIVGLYYYYIFSLPLYGIEIPVETINYKPNKCLFGLFNEMFKATNSSYVYYPSYFSPIKIKSIKDF